MRDRQRRGKIVVLTAFFLTVMIAFIALSVDVGYMYSVKAHLQNAADAGACAGAISLTEGPDTARTSAIEFAHQNRLEADEFTVLNSDVQLGTWDETSATFTVLTGSDEASANAVRVFVRRTAALGNPVGLFFAAVMGNHSADIVATATARLKNTKCGIVVGLNAVTLAGGTYVDSYRSRDGAYLPGTAGQNGNVCSNGNIMIAQYAAIHGDAHCGDDNQVLDYSIGDVSGSSAPLTEDLEYPAVDVSEAAVSNDNASIPLSTLGVNPVNGAGQFVLNGVDHVDLPRGTYYFTSMLISGGATIGVSAETIIYVNGNVVMSGASILNDTMLPKNLQIYSTGTGFTMSGTSAFYGVVYAPRASFVRSGISDLYGSIIAGSVMASGSGGIHADDSLDIEQLDAGVKRTALVD